jgi:hypothetical protein
MSVPQDCCGSSELVLTAEVKLQHVLQSLQTQQCSRIKCYVCYTDFSSSSSIDVALPVVGQGLTVTR